MTDATPGTDLTPAAATAPEAQPNRGRALMLLAPLALIAAGGAYLWTGRYVETDNAYIRADISNISPEISGTVKEVLVDDNEPVKAGQPLVKLDAINYEILLIGAEASLKNTEAAIDADRIEYRQHLQDRKIAQSELEYAERQYQRQSKLAAASAGAEAARDAAERSLKVARDKVAFADEKIKESLAKLFGDPDSRSKSTHVTSRRALRRRSPNCRSSVRPSWRPSTGSSVTSRRSEISRAWACRC